MIVTPFGSLEYGDAKMTQQWIAAHAFRHRAYAHALALTGLALQPVPLIGELDLEWVRVHYFTHMTLRRKLPNDESVSSQQLSQSPLDSEEAFYNWHRLHNLIHTQLDQALGVL